MTESAHNDATERIPLSSINFEDRYYKISRNAIRDELRGSIRDFGVLDAPVVTGRAGGCRAVSGYNRLAVLRELGAESVDCRIVRDVSAGFFLRIALLKCERAEVGPIGRLRALRILSELGIGGERLDLVAARGLHVPAAFVRDAALLDAALGMPGALRDYCDDRDIQLRVVRDLARMPDEDLWLLSSWIEFAPLRVNIFKFIVEMLADIRVRDGGPGQLAGIHPGESQDRKTWEDELYGRVRAARYPGYSALRDEADAVARYFAARGMELAYPPYFEGDRLDVKMSLGKRDDPDSIGSRLGSVDWARLKPLLDLL
jgi:hypothetical protein